MMSNVANWIRKQLFRENRKLPLDRFVLKGKKGAVNEWAITGPSDADEAQSVIDSILTEVQEDANALGSGLYTYQLFAYERGDRVGTRFSFKVRGECEEEADGEENPGNTSSLLAQAWRHNEALMRMATQGQTAVIGLLTKQLDAANARNETLLARQNETDMKAEQWEAAKHERELELLTVGNELEARNATRKAIAGKVETLLPVILNKLSGQSLLPVGDEGNVFKQLAGSLSSEQLARIAMVLTNEQKIALFSLLEANKPKAES